MADSVIRNDIVKLDFRIDGLSEINRLQNQINAIRRQLTGGIGEEAFEDVGEEADEAVRPMERVRQQGERIRQTLGDIGKRAAGAAFNALKKLAAISFKALVAGITAAATGIGVLVKKSVEAYADFEQLVGGVETLFGTGGKGLEEYAQSIGKKPEQAAESFNNLMEAQNKVLQNANNAYKTSGLSANRYMETVTSFSASLIQSVGGDTRKAAEMSDMAIVDMSDNANKMGTDMDSIIQTYQSISRGNYGMLDNLKLGYGGTKSEMERLIKTAAKMDKSVKANDMSFGNMVKAIHAIQGSLGITGTTAKEATETISGSLAAVKATWENLLPSLIQGGDSFDQCLNNLIDAIGTFGKNIMPAIEKSLAGIGTLIERFAPIIEKELPVVIDALLPPLLKAATAVIKALIKSLPSIFNTIASQLPGILKQIGEALVEALGIQDIVAKISGAFCDAFTKNPIFEKIGDFFEQNSDKIEKCISVISALAGALLLFNKIKGITSVISGLFGGGSGEASGSGRSGGIFGVFKTLAKMKPKTILKGMANLGIIFGGLLALSGVVMAVAPYMARLSDGKSLVELLSVIAALGVIGTGLSKLAEIVGVIPVSTVAKGLANMAIMISGMSALALLVGTAALLKFDYKEMYKLVGFITVLGAVGTALSVFAGISGMIPILTVLSGLANMGIMIEGMSALTMLIGAVSLLKFNYKEMYKSVGFITVLGTVGSALSIFAGMVGMIPIATVLKGLANICLVVTALSGLTILIDSVSLLEFNYKEMYKLVGFISVLGTVGSVLSIFAGIVGMVPIPVVLAGLANTALVIGGLSAIIAAFGKLSEIKGFNEFINSGGNTLANIFKQIGKIGGSLASGFAEGVLDILPTVGKKLSEFATNIKPLFALFKGVDMSGVSGFFSSFGNFMLKMAGNNLASFFTGGTDLAELGTQLSEFAVKVRGFFTAVATFPETGFTNAKLLFKSLADIGNTPKTGGIAQWFSGETDFTMLAAGLRSLASEGVAKFYNTVAALPQEGFANAKLLFKSLADIGNIPNTGGITQWFTGENDIVGLAAKLPPFGRAMAEFYQSIAGIENFSKISELFTALKGIGEAFPNSGGLGQFFSGENDIVGVGQQLKQFGKDTQEFFAMINNLNVTSLQALFNQLKSFGTIVKNLRGNVSADFNTMADAVKRSFDVMLNIVKSRCNEILQAIKNMLNEMKNIIAGTNLSSDGERMIKSLASGINVGKSSVVSAIDDIGKTVTSKLNNIIDNANSSLKQFGSKVNLEGVGYARGTDGHKGGNAVVNDGRGAELVQMPSGKAFIPQGRNVFIPNAPKGMKVFSAEQTAKIFGKKRPTFHYSDGTKSSIFGENITKISIPLSQNKFESREETGAMIGISAYTPESRTYSENNTEYNTYSPVFNLTISGTNEDRVMERKVKRWIKKAMEEVEQAALRKNPRLQEV